MARSADYRVRVVPSQGEADVSVFVVNGVVVDLTGANPGDVLTIQPDGSIDADPPAGGASQNLFIQDTPPVTALTKYQWWETAAGELVTMWVAVP